MKLEFTKDDVFFNGIRWVAKALTKDKNDLRKYVHRIYKYGNGFIATDGSRLHAYKPGDLKEGLKKMGFRGVKNGLYEVVKNTKSQVILLWEKKASECDYPGLKIIKSKAPEGNRLAVEFTYNARYSAAYTNIIKSIDMGENIFRYEFLADVLSCGEIFEVWQENPDAAINFLNGDKFAAIMPLHN